MEPTQTLPVLDDKELRVLGALMEKSKTTPDYYPMTINAITAACNQKTSRKPVVNYDDETVANTLNTLRRRGLVATATGGTARSIKYRHNFAIVFPLMPPDIAVICLLLLRGPQTPGEINTNSGRLYEFDSLEEVQEVLDKLANGQPAFIMQLPKRPGQKEQRYVHLLGGVPDVTSYDIQEEYQSANAHDIESRLHKLEEEFAELKEAFNKLLKDLNG